ncbi:MAG: hypothetical protein EOM80_18935 [Erysipelotrichia bacterium]|nr:hypothetical protein [Erysipelotrichia bacterium]
MKNKTELRRRIEIIRSAHPGILGFHGVHAAQLQVMQSKIDWDQVFIDELKARLVSSLAETLNGLDAHRFIDTERYRAPEGYLGKEIGMILMSVSTAEELILGPQHRIKKLEAELSEAMADLDRKNVMIDALAEKNRRERVTKKNRERRKTIKNRPGLSSRQTGW